MEVKCECVHVCVLTWPHVWPTPLQRLLMFNVAVAVAAVLVSLCVCVCVLQAGVGTASSIWTERYFNYWPCLTRGSTLIKITAGQELLMKFILSSEQTIKPGTCLQTVLKIWYTCDATLTQQRSFLTTSYGLVWIKPFKNRQLEIINSAKSQLFSCTFSLAEHLKWLMNKG